MTYRIELADNKSVDVEVLLDIFRRAYAGDELQAAFYPQRLVDPANPQEEHDFRARLMEEALGTPGVHCVVAVDDGVEGGERILGYGLWREPLEISGPNLNGSVGMEEAGEESKGSWLGYDWTAAVTTDELEDGGVSDGIGGWRGDGIKFPRCLDVAQHLARVKAFASMRHRILGREADGIWYLRPLAVDPDFAGRGIGTALAAYGLRRAAEQGRTAYLESTDAGLRMYRKCDMQEASEIRLLDQGRYRIFGFVKRPA